MQGACGRPLFVRKPLARGVRQALGLFVLSLTMLGCGDDVLAPMDAGPEVPTARVKPYAPDAAGLDSAVGRDQTAPGPPPDSNGETSKLDTDPTHPSPDPNGRQTTVSGPGDAGQPGVLDDDDDDGGLAAEVDTDCLALAPGDTTTLESELASISPMWLRIQVGDACPATRLSATRVAYEPLRLCASPEPRHLSITMLGGDMLENTAGALEDPMLVLYPDGEGWRDRPFSCWSANDDGAFATGRHNSARIEFDMPAGSAALLIMTSHQPPPQRGLGRFQLDLRAR